ncbi:hypothetical protein [Deinococcus multiflagellatus]|uniref:Uncharacterized protein n=1 Tax=Deinococcus multiflagellatus TaxID=1656887 RepID=A0ABW1ZR40_9DEIO|nr:hypothetical protein [Deinococcus multiflagellatus]MBZ9715793.1 hypothetical protein [Deinococcus multiflagellatus]
MKAPHRLTILVTGSEDACTGTGTNDPIGIAQRGVVEVPGRVVSGHQGCRVLEGAGVVIQ